MFIQICCSFLPQLFIIVLLSGKISLYILGIDPVRFIVCKYFFYFINSLSFDYFFCFAEAFYLMQSNLFIFGFAVFTFGVISKYFLRLISSRFIFIFSYKSSTVSVLTFSF